LKEVYKSSVSIRIIGTRHGEKLYETLVTREEMAKAEVLGNYYRILCDERGLNYEKCLSEESRRSVVQKTIIPIIPDAWTLKV
jgi:UDP-glucose 4-epimerase